jgi:hypothetical protein
MFAQTTVPSSSPQQQQGMSGGTGSVSTGEARTYSSRRTTGITDPKAPVVLKT